MQIDRREEVTTEEQAGDEGLSPAAAETVEEGHTATRPSWTWPFPSTLTPPRPSKSSFGDLLAWTAEVRKT